MGWNINTQMQIVLWVKDQWTVQKKTLIKCFRIMALFFTIVVLSRGLVGVLLLGWHLTGRILIDRNSRDFNHRTGEDLISSSMESNVTQSLNYTNIPWSNFAKRQLAWVITATSQSKWMLLWNKQTQGKLNCCRCIWFPIPSITMRISIFHWSYLYSFIDLQWVLQDRVVADLEPILATQKYTSSSHLWAV